MASLDYLYYDLLLPLAARLIRQFKRKSISVPFTFVTGLLLSYLAGGLPLTLIFALLYTEKVFLGAFSPIGMIGIELTTVSTVLAGIIYGPVFAAIYCLAAITILRGLRHIFLPVSEPKWPPFLAGPDDMLHAGGAIVAGLLAFLPIFWVVNIVSLYKTLGWAYAIPAIMDQPWNPFTSMLTIIFNATAGLMIAMFVLSLSGISFSVL